MDQLLHTLLLGIIEGITEFLPISSTGHLLIAEHWLGQRSDLFNVAIQAGAILAVVLIYWQRLCGLLLGFARPENRDYLIKLSVSFLITATGGFIAKQLGLELPKTVAPVAWALIVGGVVILFIEHYVNRHQLREQVTWKVAVAVGLGQILAAVFPGTSRSAATIFAAMLAGLSSRATATEFAFLVGIPTMFAATGYELLKVIKSGGAVNEDWTALGIGFVVSAAVAFIAVTWLLRYIQAHRFTVFAWYRIVFGVALLFLV
jgi:undecaprenyl-diphosphatase